jgi:hypothetical protein
MPVSKHVAFGVSSLRMHLKIRTYKPIIFLVKHGFLLCGNTKPEALEKKCPGNYLDPSGVKYVGSLRYCLKRNFMICAGHPVMLR